MKGLLIITTDDRVLCYVCYQEDETAELDMWIPDEPENYPRECDNCDLTIEGLKKTEKSPSKDLPGQKHFKW